MAFMQREGFQRLRQGVDQPGVGNAVMGVERQLLGAVLLAGGRRKDFAYPVRVGVRIRS